MRQLTISVTLLLLAVSVASVPRAVGLMAQLASDTTDTLGMVFSVNPPAPVANQSIVFSFNALGMGDGATVAGILIISGTSCSPTATPSVAMLDVSPAKAAGSVTLTKGLLAGQYSAFLVTGVTEPTQSILMPCFTFTVASSSAVAEFPSALLLVLLTFAMAGCMLRKRSKKKADDT